jgi:hypothetical protein
MNNAELQAALRADQGVILELQRRECDRARRRDVYGKIAVAFVWAALAASVAWFYVTLVIAATQ